MYFDLKINYVLYVYNKAVGVLAIKHDLRGFCNWFKTNSSRQAI